MAALFAGCGRPKYDENFALRIPDDWETMNFELESKGAIDLKEALSALETTLAERFPQASLAFAPGASDEEIAGLRNAIGGRKIEELEVWFRWHNGPNTRLAHLLPLGSLISIRESLKRRTFSESMGLVKLLSDIPGDSIMILNDHGGGGYFLDLSLQPPLVFYDIGEIPEVEYCGSLPEFIGFIRKAYEKGHLTIDEFGLVEGSDEFFDDYTEAYEKTATKRTQ